MPPSAAQLTSESACRRLVSWPLGLIAGVLVGAVAMVRWQAGPLAAVFYGALAAFLATRLRDWLEARMRAALAGAGGGALLAFAFDLAVGAGAGLLAAPLLGTSVLPAIGSGAALAGLWSYLVGQLLCGGTVDRAVDFLLAGDQSADFAREPIVADGEALERTGQVEGAIRKYREVAAFRPREPEAYLRAATLLQRQGRAGEAAELLRAARRRAHLTTGHEVLIGRQLADLAAGPLADPTAAVAELHWIAARFPGTPAGEAAARDAEALRGRMPAGPTWPPSTP